MAYCLPSCILATAMIYFPAIGLVIFCAGRREAGVGGDRPGQGGRGGEAGGQGNRYGVWGMGYGGVY